MSLALLFLYLMHNMFRMLIHPSSGACDLFVELFHGLYCSGSMCVGVTLWFGWGGVVSGCGLKHWFGWGGVVNGCGLKHWFGWGGVVSGCGLKHKLISLYSTSNKQHCDKPYDYFFSHDATACTGLGPPHCRGFTITETPNSVGLLRPTRIFSTR